MSLNRIARFARARMIAQGTQKTIRPVTPFLPPGRPADACAAAQCQYCKRFGPLGSCQGCGAPNVPVQRAVTILTAPGTISDDVRSRLKRDWERYCSGGGQSGRVMVLGQDVHLTQLSSGRKV